MSDDMEELHDNTERLASHALEWKRRAETAERAATENAAVAARLRVLLTKTLSRFYGGHISTADGCNECDEAAAIRAALSLSPPAALAEVRAAAWDAAISAGAEACREPRVTHGAELSEFFAGVVLALKGKGPTP